jgi:hypothetical protein
MAVRERRAHARRSRPVSGSWTRTARGQRAGRSTQAPAAARRLRPSTAPSSASHGDVPSVTAQDPAGNPLSVSRCVTRQPGYFHPSGMLVLILARNRVRVLARFDHPPNARFALPRRLNQPTRRAPAEASAPVSPMHLRPSRVAGWQALEEPVERGRVVRVQGPICRAPILAAACGRRPGLRPVRMTAAPSARARRAAPGPMPALPPITATACPARSGSRRLETLKWLRRSWFLRWVARRRVTGPPAVLASTEADAPVPRARLKRPRSFSSVISRMSSTSRNTRVADPDLLCQLGLAVLEDGGSAPLSQPWPWSAETP